MTISAAFGINQTSLIFYTRLHDISAVNSIPIGLANCLLWLMGTARIQGCRHHYSHGLESALFYGIDPIHYIIHHLFGYSLLNGSIIKCRCRCAVLEKMIQSIIFLYKMLSIAW